MHYYSDTIIDKYGREVQGATITVFDSDGNLETLYEVGGTEIVNPVTSDSYGFFEFYVFVDDQYLLEIRDGGSLIRETTVPIGFTFRDFIQNAINVTGSNLTLTLAAAEEAISAAAQATAIVNDRYAVQDIPGETTLDATMLGKWLRCTSAIDTNIYVPDELLTTPGVGFKAKVQQFGAGAVYVLPFAAAEINAIGGANKITAQFGVAEIVVDSMTTVSLSGDVSGTGGISWIESSEDFGPYVDLVISSSRAGGTLDPSKLVINETSPSFNLATGAADGTTISRTVTCTKWARLPVYTDGLGAVQTATLSGPPTTNYVRVWKDNWTYGNATVLTITVAKGWWTWNSIPGPAHSAITVPLLANSSESATSPTPYGNWIMPNRQFIGDSLTVECAPFHRDGQLGRMVAGVLFTLTDSAGTPMTQWVNAMTVSGRACDLVPVDCIKHTFDTSTLADGFIKIDAQAKSFTGGTVYDTSTTPAGRGWCTRHAYKDTTRLAAPYVVYVDASTGDDTAGVCSTTDATALASPCLTIGGALKKADAAQTYLDGVIIYLKAGTHALGDTGATIHLRQKAGWVTITHAASTTKAGVTLNLSASMRPRIDTGFVSTVTSSAIRFLDLKITRTGSTFTFAGESGASLNIIWDQCDLDGGSFTTAYLSSTARDQVYGLTVTNAAGTGFQATTGIHWIWRGLSITGVTIEQWILVGSIVSGVTIAPTAAVAVDGGFVYCNKILNAQGNGVRVAQSQNVTGFAIVQNLFEYISTSTTGPVIGLTPDGATGNLTHGIVAYNTITGAGTSAGRTNGPYDDGATRRRTKLCRFVGNIFMGASFKSDLFRWLNNATIDSPVANGNFEAANGVGWNGNLFIYEQGSSTGYQARQEFIGLNSQASLSPFVPLQSMAALFTNYQGTTINTGTGVLTAGAGGGVYTLPVGSLALAIVSKAMLGHTLDGAVRAATNDNAGAFAAA